MRPIIGITMGDAAGIGPEIALKALSSRDVYTWARPVVIGDRKNLQKTARDLSIPVHVHAVDKPEEAKFEVGTVDCVDLDLLPADVAYGVLSAEAGHAAFKYVERAVQLAMSGAIDAICTAPLNKEAMHKAGHLYPGHTEILAELTGTIDYSMLLSAPKLKVIHLTTHVGLLEAVERIDPERTYQVIRLAHDTLRRAGMERPRIAVCGINPHAGENGLFGRGEEEQKLVPGIARAAAEGVEVSGPYPADTVFYRAVRGDFDIVVACYHDQGHIPVKVLGMESGVNITVGLNHGVVRTSVDHGTAFDIAGKNVADPRSMIEAIKAAVELAPRTGL